MHTDYKSTILRQLRDQQVRFAPREKKLEQANRAEKLLKRPPIRSKAILAAQEDLTDLAVPTSVKLIGRSRPFSLDVLDPFLAPLRLAVGGAHAGS